MEVGTRLSHYVITSKLGEGGMGQVFAADDERLKREVAIKVLPAAFSQDADRLARLEREAQALARLEHPNIASIYGLEEADGNRFLVMQLVEGRTLGERVAEGPVPLEEALKIGLQIAKALELAHDRGIVHRDLKPANVMLSDSGEVRLLDFGLAKAFAADSQSGSIEVSASPTMLEATKAGFILGTAGYMSPEQARGQAVDRRTDIWAFGCVLFEMLTGLRVFGGDTVTDVLGAIVHREPEWEALPRDTPRRIRALLRRCLRKDIDRRIQAIGDARVSIEEYLEDPVAAEAILDSGDETTSGWKRWIPWGVAALLAVALVADLRPHATNEIEAPVMRMEMTIDVDGRLREFALGSAVAISPDGRYLVVAVGETANSPSELKVRPLDGVGYTSLAGDGAYHPLFSPDSEWVAYVTPAALLKVPTSGGTPQVITDVSRSRGADWGPDNNIVLAAGPAGGLVMVSADGGEPTQVTQIDESRDEFSHRWPQFLPGGTHVLFSAHTDNSDWDRATLEVVDLRDGSRTTVLRGGYYGRYVESGHLVYVNAGSLFAIPFDLDRLEVTGSAVPVVQNLASDPGTGGAQFSLSRGGTLVYRTGTSAVPTHPAVWVDDRGVQEPVLPERRAYVEARLSADGSRLAMMELTDGNWDMWMYDVARGVRTRLTFAEGIEGPAVWSPDNQYVILSSDRDGPDDLYRKRADGSGDIERLTDLGDAALYVSDWSDDGRHVIFSRFGQDDEEAGWRSGADIGYLDMEEDGAVKVFLSTEFNELEATISPDGRWMAYQSNESGRNEVYVRPFPPGGGKWQVSDSGGAYPRWAADGSSLYYRSDDGVVEVEVQSGAAFEASRPRQLFSGTFRGGLDGIRIAGAGYADYDVAPDGRFVMFPDPDATEAVNIELAQVVVNWFGELRRLAPERR